jgi:hypothetical protein
MLKDNPNAGPRVEKPLLDRIALTSDPVVTEILKSYRYWMYSTPPSDLLETTCITFKQAVAVVSERNVA